MKRILPLCAAAVLALLAHPAQAHIVSSRLGDFYAGAVHPLLTLEDLAQWLALGVLAGMQAPRNGRWVVVAFPLGLVLGAALSRLGVLGAPPELLNSGLLVVLGGLLALALDLPAIAIAALAAVLGVLRGAANLDGLPAAEDAVLVTSGILVSGYAVATLAAAVTLAFRRSGAPWRAAIVRAAGVGVAGVGCALAAFA